MKKKIITFTVIIICLIASFLLIKPEKETKMEIKTKEVEEIPKKEELKQKEIKEDNIPKIYIDVKGAIQNPGMYEMEEGMRVIHAIEKGGGLTENADTSYINLSQKLSDEMVIYVYSKEESTQIKKQDPIITNHYIYKNNDALIRYENKDNKEEVKESFPVNLNTATKEELMTIPGIGESKADLIISYRNEKPFETIEDLKNVKGIGDATFEKLKGYITV